MCHLSFAHPEIFTPIAEVASPVTPKGGKCLPPLDGIAQNNYEAPTRSYHANNQGDAKIEFGSAPVRQDHRLLRNVDRLRRIDRGARHQFPGSEPLSHLDHRHQLGAHILTFAGEFSAGGIHTDQVVRGTADGSDGVVRNIWKCQGRHCVHGSEVRWIMNQSINGGISGVETAAYNGNNLIDNTYSYIDNLTWQKGRHYLSMGVEAMRLSSKQLPDGQQ